jgi:hypothetical protein
MAHTLRRFLRVRDGDNWIDRPMTDVQREDALDTVAAVVCRLGRRLRLVRWPHGDLGPWGKELLAVLTCFDVVLHTYGWPDDAPGSSSMNDPYSWRSSWPVKWPFIPYIQSNLLEALERAGQHLQQAVEAVPPNVEAPRSLPEQYGTELPWQAQAIGLIITQPGWSVDRYAQAVNRDRATLYRDPTVKAALEARRGSPDRLHRGHKSRTGDFEAYDRA